MWGWRWEAEVSACPRGQGEWEKGVWGEGGVSACPRECARARDGACAPGEGGGW